MEDLIPLMLDIGSFTTKCGYCGDIAPKFVYPTVVGRGEEGGIVGEEAIKKMGNIDLCYPVKHGLVENWESMELFFKSTYGVMDVKSEDHPILMTESPTRLKSNREKTSVMLFENFNIPSLYIMQPGILTLYSTGRTIGLVLECGGGVTNTTAINKYTVNFKNMRRSKIAGDSVTQYLSLLLSEKEYFYGDERSFSQMELLRKMKEQACFVSEDFERDLQEQEYTGKFDNDYPLPDGTSIKLGHERFMAAEVLFRPSYFDMPGKGVDELVYKTIDYERHGPFAKKELYSNIIVAGGSTYIAGFKERLLKGVENLAPRKCEGIEIHAPENRKFSAWLGGGLVSKTFGFNEKWITKEEYEDTGSGIVWRKCF